MYPCITTVFYKFYTHFFSANWNFRRFNDILALDWKDSVSLMSWMTCLILLPYIFWHGTQQEEVTQSLWYIGPLVTMKPHCLFRCAKVLQGNISGQHRAHSHALLLMQTTLEKIYLKVSCFLRIWRFRLNVSC